MLEKIEKRIAELTKRLEDDSKLFNSLMEENNLRDAQLVTIHIAMDRAAIMELKKLLE
jgi:hypothetical protein